MTTQFAPKNSAQCVWRHNGARKIAMIAAGTALATWEEFLQLPDGYDGAHYELHDGKVVTVPPPKPVHVYLQSLLARLLTTAAGGRGWAAQEFPYRPATNLQFWHADVAYLPNEDWGAMRGDKYPVYAPPLVIEVLSPSNQPEKIHRQRVAAFSGGTREFWVVDPTARTIEVSVPGRPSRVYGVEDRIPVFAMPDAFLEIRGLFEE